MAWNIDMSFLKSPSSLACMLSLTVIQSSRPACRDTNGHIYSNYHRCQPCRANYHSPGLALTGPSKRSRLAMSHWFTATACDGRHSIDSLDRRRHRHAQSDRWWPAPPDRLEQTHMATTHQYDESPRVRLDQLIRAPTENDVDRAW